MDDKSNRGRILASAADLFLKFGIRSISMDDIAHQLGISKKTIYQHFSDKDDIVTQVMEAHLAHEREAIQSLKTRATDAVDLLIGINLYLRRNLRETTTSMLRELQKYHNKAWSLMDDFKKEFIYEIILENLTTGIQDGYFRNDINPAVTSRIRLEGVSMAFNEDVFPKGKFNLIEVSDSILDHFILGITTEKGRKLYMRYKNQQEKSALNEHA